MCHLQQLTATSEADELIPDAGAGAQLELVNYRVNFPTVHSGKIQIFGIFAGW